MSDNNQIDYRNIQNMIFQFNIPMAFDVLNSMKEDDKGKPYIVTINNIPVKLHFERIYDYKYKDDIPFGQNSKITEDRNAILSYTRVQVWIDEKIFKLPELYDGFFWAFPDRYLDIIITYINKFIYTYKDITGEFWLRYLVKKDIFKYHLILIDKNGNQQNSQTLIQHELHCNGEKEFQIEEDKDSFLRRLLTIDYYNFERDMLFQIENNFNLKNYNIALVQVVTWFEHYLYSNLRKDRKISNTQFKKLEKREECGCFVGISEICRNGIKKLFEFDFEKTDEYKNLKDNAFLYRNKIVHGIIKHSIEKEICYKGINAVMAAKKMLDEKIFNTK